MVKIIIQYYLRGHPCQYFFFFGNAEKRNKKKTNYKDKTKYAYKCAFTFYKLTKYNFHIQGLRIKFGLRLNLMMPNKFSTFCKRDLC